MKIHSSCEIEDFVETHLCKLYMCQPGNTGTPPYAATATLTFANPIQKHYNSEQLRIYTGRRRCRRTTTVRAEAPDRCSTFPGLFTDVVLRQCGDLADDDTRTVIPRYVQIQGCSKSFQAINMRSSTSHP